MRSRALLDLPGLAHVKNWTFCDEEVGLHRLSLYGSIQFRANVLARGATSYSPDGLFFLAFYSLLIDDGIGLEKLNQYRLDLLPKFLFLYGDI